MSKLLPLFTWIKTKDGTTGTIVERYSTKPDYLVDYVPLSQCEDDDQFAASNEDIVAYVKPEHS